MYFTAKYKTKTLTKRQISPQKDLKGSVQVIHRRLIEWGGRKTILRNHVLLL